MPLIGSQPLVIPGANGWSGPVLLAAQTSAVANDFDVLRLASSGLWGKADASAAATADGFLGIALSPSGYRCNIGMAPGIVRNDALTLTPGSPVYLSETSGAITTTMPEGSGVVVRVLGHALTATAMYFCPSVPIVLT